MQPASAFAQGTNSALRRAVFAVTVISHIHLSEVETSLLR